MRKLRLREGRDFPRVTEWLGQGWDEHSGVFFPDLGRQIPDGLSWEGSLRVLVYPFMLQIGKQGREGA